MITRVTPCRYGSVSYLRMLPAVNANPMVAATGKRTVEEPISVERLDALTTRPVAAIPTPRSTCPRPKIGLLRGRRSTAIALGLRACDQRVLRSGGRFR